MKKSTQKTASASQVAPASVAPTTKPQIVLLAVTGMTPAVLTETVWALAHEKIPVIPDRVVAVTTTRGKQLLEQELFTPASDAGLDLWQTLRQKILGDQHPEDHRLILDTIREITAPNPRTGRNVALEDFRTSDENAAMANFILEQVRSLVETPNIQLITSIAGGRKSLGALLYACMSLLGRETDRLTHVLVNEPFDNFGLSPRFYFPEQPMQSLKTAEGKMVAAKQASIDLGDIPFVPLRNLFERDFIKKPCSFTELVGRCRQKVSEVARRNVKLVVRRSRREIEVNGLRIRTSITQHILMLFLVDPTTADSCRKIQTFRAAIDELRIYAEKLKSECSKSDGNDWRDEAVIPCDFERVQLSKALNELKNKLREAGPEADSLIPLLPVNGRFPLDLPPTAITVRD